MIALVRHPAVDAGGRCYGRLDLPVADLAAARALGARVALVSVGEHNDYGHPAPDVLAALTAAGTRVWRTDLAGDVAVVVRDDEVGVVARD